MKFQSVQLDQHGKFVIRQPYDDEEFFCPLCAISLDKFQPYNTAGQPAHDMICEDCMFQPSYDDCPFNDWSRSYEDYLMAYRINWLDGPGWKEEYFARLKRVLGIDEPKLREREDELRAEWKRCWDNRGAEIRQGVINRAKMPKPDSE